MELSSIVDVSQQGQCIEKKLYGQNINVLCAQTNEAGGEIISYESFYLEQLNNSKEFDLTEDYFRLIKVGH